MSATAEATAPPSVVKMHKPLPSMHRGGSSEVAAAPPSTTEAAQFARLCEAQAAAFMTTGDPTTLPTLRPHNQVPQVEVTAASTATVAPTAGAAVPPAQVPAAASRPLVTIIMPVHNAAAFLPATLVSILHQTYRPLELCVYDDQSTDASLEVLAKFAAPFAAAAISMHLASSTTNGQNKANGAGYARNRAMEMAHGEYYAHQDADDLSLPRRIEAQMDEWQRTVDEYQQQAKAAASSTASPNASTESLEPLVLVGCHFERLPQDATPRWTRWLNGITRAQLVHHAFREVTLPCPTWFTSRRTFATVGPFPELLGEDMHFFYSSLLAVAHPHTALLTKVTGDPLLVYRNHASNLCGRTPFSYLFDLRVKALERLVLEGDANTTTMTTTDGGSSNALTNRYPAFRGARFTIWNAGKAGKRFYRALSPAVQDRVIAFCDIDPKKIERGVFQAHVPGQAAFKTVPIISWEQAQAPIIICVRQELEDNESQREFRHRIENVKGWKEGVDYLFLS